MQLEDDRKRRILLVIEVRHLVKRYGSRTAVDDLSFTIEKGQVVGFLGPNGAGKSTTMNIITGYIPATSGTVIVDGHDILEEPMETKRAIGYLPEMPPLYPDMRVEEYLRFTAELKSVPKSARGRMMEEIMELVCVADRKRQLIRQLSKGYKQRVGIAGALMGYPKVIILDEPTVGLDPGQIIEIRDLIRGLGKKHTVILSSHILSEVGAVCDQIMIINQGRLAASDAPEHLMEHMQAAQTLKLMVKGEEAQILQAFDRIEGVEECQVEGRDDGLIFLTVQSKAQQDIREEVFYALADARCPALEMKSETRSLEDIFLELTQEDSREDEKLQSLNGEEER